MEGTSGLTTVADSLTSSNFNMKDEVDEEYSIVKIEISSQDDEQSTIHQPNSFETGPRRSSRKRKPLVKTLMMDTDGEEEEVASVSEEKSPVSKKRSKKSSHQASSENVFNQLPKPVIQNISKLEKQLGKFLVIHLTRCDTDSGKKSKSRWPHRTPEARIKKMTRSEGAWDRRKKQLEELKKKGIYELRPFKPRKNRKTPEEVLAAKKARDMKYREKKRRLLNSSSKINSSSVEERAMSRAQRAWEKRRQQLEELKKKGIPTPELKPLKPRKSRKAPEAIKASIRARNKRSWERTKARLLLAKTKTPPNQELGEDDNDCLAEVNESWLTSSVVNLIPPLPPLSPSPPESSAKARVPSPQEELDKNTTSKGKLEEGVKKKKKYRRGYPEERAMSASDSDSGKKPNSRWPNRTPEEWARIKKMTRSERAWERRKKQLEELKKKGIPTPELKPFIPRKKRKDPEVIKAANRARNKKYQEQNREGYPVKRMYRRRMKDKSPPPLETDRSEPGDILIVENPRHVPLQLPKRFTRRLPTSKTSSSSTVDRRHYVESSTYHLKTRLLKQKAQKDLAGDTSPLSIPALYGIPFSELTPPEQEIILEILERLGTTLNVEGEWTPKVAALKAEKVAELKKKAQKLRTTSVPCPVCDSSFLGLPAVEKHLISHFKNAAEPWVKCKFCQSLHQSPTNLYQHYRNVHLKLKQFFCSTCGKGFGDKINIERHEATHRSEEKLLEEGVGVICQTCGKVFPNWRLRDHEVKVHGKGSQHLCSICGVTRNTLATLQEHIATHMNSVEREEYEEKRRREKAVSRLRLTPLMKDSGEKHNQKNTKIQTEEIGIEMQLEESSTAKEGTHNDKVSVAEEDEQEAASQGDLEDCNVSNFDEEEVGGEVEKAEAEVEPKLEPDLIPHELSTVVDEGIGAIIRIIPLEEFEGEGEEVLEDPVKAEVEWEDHDGCDNDELTYGDNPEWSPPTSPVPILIPVETPREPRSKRRRAKRKRMESESGSDTSEEEKDEDFTCPSDPDFDPGELSDQDFNIKRRLRGSSRTNLASSSKAASSGKKASPPLPPAEEKRVRGRPRKHLRAKNDRRNYRKKIKNKLFQDKKLAKGIPMRKARRLNETEPKPTSKELPKKKTLRKSKASASTSHPTPKKGTRSLTLEAYQKAHSLHTSVCSSDLLQNPNFSNGNFLEKTSPSVGHGTFENPHWTLLSSSKLHCICPACGQTFKDVNSLSLHKKASHPFLSTTCQTCAKPIRYRSTGYIHKICHSTAAQLEAEYEREVAEFGTPPPKCNDRLYKCSQCPDTRLIFGWEVFKEHQVGAHPKVLPSCDICGKPMKQKCTLIWHRQTHFSVEEREEWWAEWKTKHTLGRGRRWMEEKIMKGKEERTFSKKEIGGFYWNRKEKKQVRRTRVRGVVNCKGPAICPTCGKVFKTIYVLKAHELRKHTEEKAEKSPCPVCRCPLDKYQLSAHVPTHFGEEEKRIWEGWNGRWEEFLECVNSGKELPRNPKLKRYQGKGGRPSKPKKPQGPKRPRGRPKKGDVWPPPESLNLEGNGDSACSSSTLEFYQSPNYENYNNY